MNYYTIEYVTDSGITGSWDGNYESQYEFLTEANAFAHESGVLPQDENILEDCEWDMVELTKPSEDYLDLY